MYNGSENCVHLVKVPSNVGSCTLLSLGILWEVCELTLEASNMDLKLFETRLALNCDIVFNAIDVRSMYKFLKVSLSDMSSSRFVLISSISN